VQLLRNFPAFYGTRKFITMITRAPLLVPIPSKIDPVHTTPSCLRSILILSTYIRLLIFLVVSFLLAFPPISYMHSSSPHSCYISRLSHPTLLHHSNYTWRRVHVMNLLIMQLSPFFRQFISLLSKYSPQHLVLKHPQSMFSLCICTEEIK
jgi:hypothetical protein